VLLIEGKILLSFNDYFNTLKKQIAKICQGLDKTTNFRIEYDDLFQEASLKLFQIYKDKRPLDINYSLRAVRNHLLNYIKLCQKDLIYEAESLDEVIGGNEDLNI